MARRKSSPAKQSLAKLRKRGLTRAKPKGRLGGSAYATLRKLSAVLEGKAQPVKLSGEAKKRYAKDFPIARGKAIIPIHQGEKIRVRKSGELVRTTRTKKKLSIIPKSQNLLFTLNIPGGPNTTYRFNFKPGPNGQRFSRNVHGKAELERFMQKYDLAEFIDSIEVVDLDDPDAFREYMFTKETLATFGTGV